MNLSAELLSSMVHELSRSQAPASSSLGMRSSKLSFDALDLLLLNSRTCIDSTAADI